MSIEGGAPCRCGNHGCLETLVSEPAILEQAHKIAAGHQDGLLAQHLKSNQASEPVEAVFAAARLGDPVAESLLEERARYLGLAVAGLVNVFNPQMIIFGGIFAQGQDLLLPTVINTVRQTSFGGLGKRVQMQATTFGWKAGVIGAAALGLMYFFYQQAESSVW
jgi:predicted NBD/HSP70 family sugar kinase